MSETRPPLPQIGVRVLIISGRRYGFRGEVIRHDNRRVIVALDEWPGEEYVAYHHWLNVGAY